MYKLQLTFNMYRFDDLSDYNQESEIAEFQLENRDMGISRETAIDSLRDKTVFFIDTGDCITRIDMDDIPYGIPLNVKINNDLNPVIL